MKVVLRDIDKQDTANIVKWRNSPHVLEYFLDQTLLTEEKHNEWLNTKVLPGFVKQMIILVPELKMDVGTVFLRDIDRINLKAEFGIFIGELTARGKGIGKQATQQIVEVAFSELCLHKVYLRVLKRNDQAIAMYEKVGFKQCGFFRDDVLIENNFEDIIFMEILK
jgi:UDP-4-amino-4,6-dideoxy-N-acetyl-beta-L-altrosamine N-acetyltransferase